MANIGHASGGKIIALTAIAHSTYKGNAEWHFIGRCEWDDGSHARRPEHEYDIAPYSLRTPENGDQADIDKAMAAMNDYLARNGRWTERGKWIPHKKTGREEFAL